MTEAELAKIRARHEEEETDWGSVCLWCGDLGVNTIDWPCDAAKLLAEIDRLRGVMEHVCDAAMPEYTTSPAAQAAIDELRAALEAGHD